MKKRGISMKPRLPPLIKNPNKLLKVRFSCEILSLIQIKVDS